MPTILVAGATGKQGGALVKALEDYNAKNPSNIFDVLALTRNPSSEAAQKLNTIPHVQCVKGDLDDPASIEQIFSTAAQPIYGVFSVQDAFQPNEVKQGITLVDIAVKYGVQRFLYSGVDQSGGLNPNPTPHFETKRQIEQRIRALPSSVSWTIFRPSGFPDILTWPAFPEMMLAVLYPTALLKVIAVSDIGKAAAEVLTTADQDKFKGQTIELTADQGTITEFLKVLEEEKGEKHELNPDLEIPEVIRNGLEGTNKYPFVGTPEGTKKWFPFVKSFREWVKTEYK